VRDDSIRRFIVRHYRYDPDRHERRHVVVGVFDNKREYMVGLEKAQAELERRRARGEADPREHISGTVREAGDDRRAANGHLLTRAIRHGVAAGKWVEDLELPSNIAVMRHDDATRSPGRWLRSLQTRFVRWLGRSGRP
jgi:hypothetical protein